MGDRDMEETVKFVRNFDRFFDCLNVSNLSEGRKSRKLDLYPYRTPDDTRFDVSAVTLGECCTHHHVYIHVPLIV